MRVSLRLDSSSHDHWGRAWARGLGEHSMVLAARPDGTTILEDGAGRRLRDWTSPLDALEWLDASRPEMQADERWVGYVGYDLGRWFEDLPATASDDLKTPLMIFSRHRLDDPAPPLPAVQPQAAQPQAAQPQAQGTILGSTFGRDEYVRAIARAIKYIADGDIFQVNLSQRFAVSSTLTAQEAYARIQSRHPAIYAAMLDYAGFSLICNSPELFLRVWNDEQGNRRVLTRPIKGTRPLLAGMREQLDQSAKDAAELNMIVDLERNDLGRVSRIGSVRVTQRRTIEAHPTVYHGVASIEGALRDDVGLVDLLRATFPGGSITGAPKIRAMQIIEEIEPVRRGPYCGAIGYIDADGTMQFNIAIRTIIAAGGAFHVPVGGGIVADSQGEAEYDETLVKARAAFEALGVPAEKEMPWAWERRG